MDKDCEFVSFVIYAYNDEKNIKNFLEKFYSYVNTRFENFEIICVDDASNDNTVKIIDDFCSKGTSITIVNMGFHQGLEISMNAGVDIAIGDFVYEFDSINIIYDLEVIYEIFQECREGSDIVVAFPDAKQKLFSKLFYSVYNTVSKSFYKLHTDVFRILSRRAINRVRSMSHILPYRKAVYANCGLVMKDHVFHAQNYIFKQDRDNIYNMKVAIDALVLYTSLAYKLAISFAMLMLLITVGISIYALVIRMSGIPVAGWTSSVLVMCLGFFGLSFITAILTKYTELILQTVFSQHKYVIKSVNRISR